jgi:hypothetical protein
MDFGQGPELPRFFTERIGTLLLLDVPHKLDPVVILILVVGAIENVFSVCPSFGRVQGRMLGKINKGVN